jgi:ubiquinone/menaquinone biosynthesis C-methylase UbiE
MMRTLLASLICLSAFAQVSHQPHHPPRSAEAYERHLESEEREQWQQPGRVVETLALRSDEVVADIGAGSGYFTRRFAPHVAKVLAVDIDEKLFTRAKATSPANVETVLATPADPKLPAAAVDTIFICDVLHHIDAREAYYEKLTAALKPGGRIVIVDFYKKELPVGPPPGMKLTRAEVIAEFKQAGFPNVKSHAFLEHQYFLEFRR